MTGIGQGVFCPRNHHEKNFWRILSITRLDNYPEKTDGLEQRLAAGKDSLAAFLFSELGVPHGQNAGSLLLPLWQIDQPIDRLPIFSVSSRRAARYLISPNA